ncbi:MAG: YggT family protein [Anaerolineae bacterium]
MIVFINFIDILARLLSLAILVRVLLSWIPIDRSGRFAEIILQITEPVVGPIRKVLPSLGGLDFSPMVAMILLEMVRTLLINLLLGLA